MDGTSNQDIKNKMKICRVPKVENVPARTLMNIAMENKIEITSCTQQKL